MTMQNTTALSEYELERGKPMPSKLHARVQSNLNFQLQLNYRDRYDFFTELSLALDGWDCVPDISIYEKTDIDFQVDEVELTLAPLCAIEIISPSQSLYTLIAKAATYFEKNVKSCWLIVPILKNIYVFESREVYEIFKADQTLTDKPLGISLSLSEVFK
jgi:Uma2 family endonuclease